MRNALILLGVLLISGCSSKQVKEDTIEINYQKIYQDKKERFEKTTLISPGFTLKISHSVDGNISGEYKVDFKGQLKLPYKITVEAAGISINELEQRLASAYKSYIKSNNVFNISIAKREYLIEIRGLIEKPGIYTVKLDTSLEEVIASAGGLQGAGSGEAKGGSSKPEFVRILKSEIMGDTSPNPVHWIRLADYFLKYDVNNEILWRGGERLFFQIAGDTDALKQQASTIQVMGEIHKPGEYSIVNGADLYKYISDAGGPTANADMEEITIVYRTNGGTTEIDLTEGTKIVPLSPGDVVLVKAVHQYKPTIVERIIPTLLSITSIITSVALLIFAI